MFHVVDGFKDFSLFYTSYFSNLGNLVLFIFLLYQDVSVLLSVLMYS